jgi:hypothetical protein
MAIANLSAYNAIEHSVKSVNVILSGSPEDVIQLTIGQHKYTFNAEGRLVVETLVESCISVDNRGCCATLGNNNGCCVPTDFKSED